MAKKRSSKKSTTKKQIDSYSHADKKRVNNPPVGLVTPHTDPVEPAKKTYEYDPHLDPQLVWAGKAERTSFDVPTVSLHVHERIDPKSIIAAVRTNGDRAKPGQPQGERQLSLFEDPEETLPLRDALDFYKHPHGWTNRLVAGDSLLVMNSLLEKEGMAGKVQMIYIDPPYGIRYGSNFQPFVNRRDVKDGKDEDLTQEPETLKAFRDTWELGIHSYLTYLRDRLLLARELLHESGSVFVQISDENLHHVRELMDEVFGVDNFASLISFSKGGGGLQAAGRPASRLDYLCWYTRDTTKTKFHQLYESRTDPIESGYTWAQFQDGNRRRLTRDEKQDPGSLEVGTRFFTDESLTKPGPGAKYTIEYCGRPFDSGTRWWGTPKDSLQRVINAHRVIIVGNKLRFVRFFDQTPGKAVDNLWDGFGGQSGPTYVVQTNLEIIKRCILMTSDPGDLVIDPTCGSGSTAYVAEQCGRRWITCDTSRVAITLAKQRLMTAVFDYYKLAHPQEGIGSGFLYKTVPHVTLQSIANNPEIREGMPREKIDAAIVKYATPEPLYDQPVPDKTKARVTGPFTVEAVPAINVLPIDGVEEVPVSDASVARSGPTSRQDEWRSELARTGVRGKGGARIDFARLEILPGARSLHAVGETNDAQPKSVAVSFGPEHAPLEQRQVEQAWEEARGLTPKPDILLFAAFHFDPEAAKDIDELDPKKAGMQFLKLQMNTDLLTDDLKKKRSSNESFWLIGQPDVDLRQIKKGDDKGLWEIEVNGFDYYDPVSGKVDPGDTSRIAMWLLDTDYDGRSLYPRQVFFPMSGEKDGWSRLAKTLRAEIDDELIEAYRGTVSLPFDRGDHGRVAIKIVDDRGIESLKIINFEK